MYVDSVGDSMPPCGTPFLNCVVFVLFLNALRPLM